MLPMALKVESTDTNLEHDHSVSSDNDHSNSRLFTAWFLFERIVKDDIQVDLFECQSNDFVKLACRAHTS